VVVLAGDELDRRRVLHVLERAGFRVEHGDADALPDVVIDLGHATGSAKLGAGSPLADVPHVLVLSKPDRATTERALAAGAVGIVHESDIDDRLAATVHAAAVGQLCVPNEHAEAVARPLLSPREKQVMSMVVLGFTNQEIANKLHVTETTVKSHLSSAYRKLRVRSRHEATARLLSDQSLGLGILTLAGDRAGG
jgi:DNA-binding NarL/FixJ family response regulator